MPLQRFVIRLLLAASCLTSSGELLADDTADEADLQFELAADAYQRGEFREALEHFLTSNRLVPNNNVVYNIARTYEQLGKYPEAYRYYDQTLQAESDPAARANIEEAIARIRPQVAVLRVLTDPPGATVYVERRDLGPRGSSPRTLGLSPGSYRVIAELPGYLPAETVAPSTPAGQETVVRLKLSQILGRARIEGTNGTAVRLGDARAEVRCRVPCTLELPPGTHRLHLSLDDHRTAELPVEVKADETVRVEERLPPLTGTLVINTDEPGALVEIDGRPRGFTPTIVRLPVGPHELRVSRRGFRSTQRLVTVKHQRQVRLDLMLTQSEEVEAVSRLPERVEDAPSSVTIIPRLELRALAYPTIAEATRGVPGVYLWDDQAYVSMGVRGLGRLGSYTNRVLVLHDGTPTNENWVGAAFVGYDAMTDLGDVERIEVVRGPGSAMYGTGAFSGVINVVTRRDLPSGAEAGVSTNQDGVARGRLRGDLKLGKHAGAWFSVAGARSRGRDFYFPEYATVTPVRGLPGEALGVDGFEAGTVRGQAWWRSLSLRWFLHRHAKQMPGAAFETLLGDPRSRQTDTRGFVELRAEPELAPGVTLMSRLHHDHYLFRGQYPRDAIDAGVEVDTYRGQWMGLEERLVFRLTESWRFTVGGEGQVHYMVEQRAFDDEGFYLDQSGADAKPYQVGAAYAVTDADLAEWMHASLGARLDAYSTFGTSLNPRVAVILRPYAQGNTKLLGGKAFRAPSIYELYYNDGGYTQIESPDLQPESIYSAEIEHTHRFSPTVAGSVSGYANYVSDLVDTGGAGDETDPIYYFNSDTPLMVVGTEATVRRDWRQGWMVSAGYGLSHARFLRSQSGSDVLGLRRDPEHRHVSNVPQHSATFKGAVPILARRMTAATRLTVEGTRWDRYETVGDPPQGRSDAHVLWDVVLSAHEERWGLDYAFGVYNLFDWEYGLPVGNEYRQRTMPQRGRTFLASVDVRL